MAIYLAYITICMYVCIYIERELILLADGVHIYILLLLTIMVINELFLLTMGLQTIGNSFSIDFSPWLVL